MAREPVTRMRLDAYRFGQRRMESALARRDPVLLHEEIRGQRRVVTSGLALAMLALVGAFGYARLTDKPAWERQSVVQARSSGRMFVVIHSPDRLVPVRNLAAARLVLAAVVKRSGRGGGEGGTANPTVMDDAALEKAPRTAAAAVPGADASLPQGDELAAIGPWAVCDVAGPDPAGGGATVLVAGATAPRPLPDDGGLLLKSRDGDLYLVLGNRRYRVDHRDAVLRAYDLVDAGERAASDALLAAIPEGAPLRVRAIPGAGASGPGGLPAAVGDVVRVSGDRGDKHYVVLPTGVQEVSTPVANLLRIGVRADLSRPPPTVSAEQVNSIPRVSLAGLDQYPAVLPRIAAGPGAGAVCWQWGADGKGGTLTADRDAPVPPGQPRTRLAQADNGGPKLDEVSVPAGTPIVVRTAAARDGSGEGLWLVSDTGVGYPIAAGQNGDNETAAALGIRPEAASRAPEQALRLLPAAEPLDLQSATRTVDVPSS